LLLLVLLSSLLLAELDRHRISWAHLWLAFSLIFFSVSLFRF
jgi:hypothetical protein